MAQKGEEPSSQWLLESIPSLPRFVSTLPRLLQYIQRACSVETGRHGLGTYFLFLAEHTPEDLVLETATRVAQIITSRFAVITRVFAVGGRGSPDAALAGLLGLFKKAIEVARCTKVAPQADDGTQLLLVTFPAGGKAILHTALIEASYLLLSIAPPTTTATANYRGLLSLWFSPQGLAEACAVDTGERVPLVPLALLSHVLSSTNSLLVDAAVKIATHPQLCSYVQLCGVPVASMSRVLEALDTAVQSAPKPSVFREGLRDPALLCRCVEAQMMRGIEHGRSFALYLRELADLTKPADVAACQEGRLYRVAPPLPPPTAPRPSEALQLALVSENKMEEVLRVAFASARPISLDQCPSGHDLWCGLLSFALETITSSSPPPIPTPISTLVSVLHRLVTSDGGAIVQGMGDTRVSCSLLRLLTRVTLSQVMGNDALKGMLKDTIICVSEALERLGTPAGTTTPTFAALLASVRCCLVWMGVAQPSEGEGGLAARRALSSLLRGAAVFDDESLIVHTCKDLLGPLGSPGPFSRGQLVEELLCKLAKEAIRTGQEGNYIRVLCKLQPFLWAGPPTVFQAAPQVFSVPSSGSQSAAPDSSKEEPMDTGAVSPPGPQGGTGSIFSPTTRGTESCFSLPPQGSEVTLDGSGLLVDLIEVLDPEILSLEPDAALKLVFDGSPAHKLGHMLMRQPSQVSGQEYLLARITHECSLNTRSKVLQMVLEGLNLRNV